MLLSIIAVSSVRILTLAVRNFTLNIWDAVNCHRFHCALGQALLKLILSEMLDSRFMKVTVICEDYPFRV